MTREALLLAGERAFAERGIEAVTVSEITAGSGARNNSAVAYHFGSKLGLLEAVLLPHYADVDAHRDRILDRLEAGGEPSVVDVADALVLPPAAKLEDASGQRYLQIQAHLLGYPDHDELPESIRWPWARPSIARLQDLLVATLARPGTVAGPVQPDHRWVLVSGLVLHGLADHTRTARPDGADRAAFVRSLHAAVVAVLDSAARGAPAIRTESGPGAET